MNKFILMLTLVLTLTGCGNTLYRENLVDVTTASHFVLEDHLEYSFDLENAFGDNVTRIVKIKKGVYTATSENELGIFYTTHKEDYNYLNIIIIEDEVFHGYPSNGFHMGGGIWISKTADPEAFPYFLYGKTKPYTEGLSFFKSNDHEPSLSENINKLEAQKSLNEIPILVPEGTNLLLADIAMNVAVQGIIASTIGKRILELKMPQDIFESNITINKGDGGIKF